MKRIVVVGNGIAGLTAADSLRGSGYDGELIIIGDERHPAYSRPALSKALLAEGAADDAHRLPPPNHEATELLGRAAIGLDPDRRLITTDDGTEVPYEGLVIATGSRARTLGGGGVLALRGLDDAIRLRTALTARPEVVVVGGGPLGMEIASAALAVGCGVTVVSQRLPMLDQVGSHLAQVLVDAARARGLRVVLTPEATTRETSGGTEVVLGDGAVRRGDLVVAAVGDVPNLEWLAGTGLLTTEGALAVDSRGRVRPGIVAAGDLATIPTRRGLRRIPLWTSAIDQAKTAGAALLRGEEAPALDLRPYFWTEQFGITLKAAGFLPVGGEPDRLAGEGVSALLRWGHPDGTGTAAAVDYRIPVPKLRRLCDAVSEGAA